MSSDRSINHHWLPQCLTRPWAGDDHLVESIAIQQWGLSSRRLSTKSIGSVDYLHRIELIEEPNFFESVFRDVETKFSAAKSNALTKGFDALSLNERHDFAFFVATLANRRAEKLTSSISEATDGFSRELSPELSSLNPCAKVSIAKGLGSYVALRAVMEFAADHYQSIADLEWRIIDFSSVNLKLVLADRPLWAWAEGARIERLTLPLGPDHLFVAGKFPLSKEVIFAEQFREVLAGKIVGQQFRQAANFVVATTRE